MSIEGPPESNVVGADFHEHRKQIATENSPFGPVLTGLVEIEILTEPVDTPSERSKNLLYPTPGHISALGNPFDGSFYDF